MDVGDAKLQSIVCMFDVISGGVCCYLGVVSVQLQHVDGMTVDQFDQVLSVCNKLQWAQDRPLGHTAVDIECVGVSYADLERMSECDR